ncbi:hypothetical protein V5799_002748 [Amblyomma americanum]|uniref:Uncharacterized protein n=1 Tax=Amblyomma americanum TaxID=6943 RepID=A0AAQ4DAX9_AMBAM
MGDCKISDYTKWRPRHYHISCDYLLRGLVAKYDVEMIFDRRSNWMTTEVHVDNGWLTTHMDSHLGDCRKCTRLFRFDVGGYMAASLMPLQVPVDLPGSVIKQFEQEVVSRAKTEIAHALNRTYKYAVAARVALLKGADFAE